jgi:hypothetical protein
MAYEEKPGSTNAPSIGGEYNGDGSSGTSSYPVEYAGTNEDGGYQIGPGATGDLSAGGEYDNLETADSLSYTNLAAQSAGEAALSAAEAAQSLEDIGNALQEAEDFADDAAASAASAATSATSAGTSATNAANSATSASTSATTATTKAAEAVVSADNAATSATTATTKAAEASTSASNAATSASTATTKASEAATSATNAANSATTATTKASEASASASSAATSATTATTQAGIATTSATNASNSATAASTSATNAATSATSAFNYATTAVNSATTATTQATNAAASATSASTSATNAATSATSASNSATSATASAATATTKAAEAVVSATNASDSASAASTSATNAAGSASAANTSATNAATSATNASNSATTAVNSATTATTQATNAAASAATATTQATNAATSAATATTKASEAASSATSAAGSATTATDKAAEAVVSANNAASSASAASTSATAASTSATNAATSATSASGSATTATTKATEAAASALAASTSETNAATSAATATTQATNAATSATSASNSATSASDSAATATTQAANASTSATNAANSSTSAGTSATNAAGSASSATTSASAASTSATNAATSATSASTSASTATTSATSAISAQAAAEAARDQALAAFDNFDDKYLGEKAVAPTVDNDGNPLQTGALYFNTVSNSMKVYSGTAWLDAYASLSGALLAANNLNDLSNVVTARTNLGLGTAATTNSTAYATAAQGTLADNAVSAITSNDGSVVISPTGTIRDLSVGLAASTATLISQVRNETGATLTKGTVVYISGASGNKALVSKAIATGDSTSAQTYGMVQADITNNNNGYVVIIGVVSGLDTSAFTEGAQLYLSGVTAGAYTSTKPYAPLHLVYVGVVTRSHANQGTIEVKIQNGYEMDELHDVSAQSPANGDTLVYVSSTDLWTKTPQSTLSVASAAAVPFSGVTGKPTTLDGYGITDAYRSSNPSNYINTAQARAAISVTGAGSYDSATGVINIVGGVTSFNTRTGAISLTSGDVTGALGFTPYNSTNPSGYITSAALSPYLTTASAASTYAPLTGTGASGTWGISISGSAAQLGGKIAQDAVGANTIPTRNGDGYSYFNYINSNTGNSENAPVSQVITTQGSDGFYRKASIAHFTSAVQSNASGTWGISISGNSATVTNGLYKVGTNAIPAYVSLNTTADNWMWLWQASSGNDWYLGPTTANFGLGGSRLAISSSGSSPNAELSIERGTTRLLEILQANLQYKGNVVLHAGNYSSYSLPLSGGTISGALTINAGSSYPLQVNSTQRYIARFYNTSVAGAGWWLANDANTLVFHADSSGDKASLNTDGVFITTGSFRAPLFYDNNDTAFYTDPASTSNVSLLHAQSLVVTGTTTDRNVVRVIPKGASASYNNTVTGAFKIRLPIRANDTMWRMTVKIYNYSENNISEYNLGNYSYSAGSYNSAASFNGSNNATARTVRFGNDGSYDCVWIGETDGTWSHPVIAVTDFVGGYANASGGNWDDNWDISLATSFGTVAGTITPANKFYAVTADSSMYSPIYYDSNNTAYYTDPTSTSRLNSMLVGNGAFADIRMTDDESPNGQKYIHANGNNIGFLSGAGSWIFRVDNGGTAIAESSLRAPIFYDSNDTTYYLDPNSSTAAILAGSIGVGTLSPVNPAWGTASNTKQITLHGSGYGVLNLRGDSTTSTWYSMGVGDGRFYAAYDSIAGVHRLVFYGANMGVNAGSSPAYNLHVGGTGYATGDFRAPIFYDGDNTGFYTDPASTSRMSNINYDNLYFAGDTTYGLIGRNGYLDTVNGRGSDPLELNYYDGGPVKIGSGTNGSKALYASELYSTIFYDSADTGYYLNPNGSSLLYGLVLSGNQYFRPNTWIQMDGNYGIYWPSSTGTPHWNPNSGTYGPMELSGIRNSYSGIRLPSSNNTTIGMFDSSGNGGLYNYSYWIYYWLVGNACLGVRTSSTSASYAMYVDGGIYSTGNVVAYSDARKKREIVTVDNALATVNKLRGVFYKRIETNDEKVDPNKRQIGVIAQEVNEVLPEAVTYAKDVDEYGVQYGNMAGLFIEAIKELNATVEKLNSRIEELEKKVNT